MRCTIDDTPRCGLEIRLRWEDDEVLRAFRHPLLGDFLSHLRYRAIITHLVVGSKLGRVRNMTKLWQSFSIPCYHIPFRILTIVRYQRPRCLAAFELGLFDNSLLTDSFFIFAAMRCHQRHFRVDFKSKHLGTCVCLWNYRWWIFWTIWRFVRRIFCGKMVLNDGVVGAGAAKLENCVSLSVC